MHYVQYYWKDLTGELAEAIGDRGVVILDGRNSIETMKQNAIHFNGKRRPHYEAFRIFKGDSFIRSKPITELILLDNKLE
jgi:predicted sulfurtransferase